MADPTEPEADDLPDPEETSEPTEAADDDHPESPAGDRPRARRGLDRRTVAIAAVLGVIAALATVLVASFFTSDDHGSDAMQLQDPDALMKVQMETAAGKPTTLGDLQETGHPMVVNLWQSACVPCVKEMPMLEKAHAANPDIDFVGVATQDDLAKAKKLADQTGITYPWIVDEPGELFYEAGADRLPTTLLLDADGTLITSKQGRFTSTADLQSFLDQAG